MKQVRTDKEQREKTESKEKYLLTAMEQESSDVFHEEYAAELTPELSGQTYGKKKLIPKNEEELVHTKRKYRKWLLWLLALSILFLLCFCYYRLVYAIPDKVRIMVNQTEQFDFKVPIYAEFSEEDNLGVLSVNETNIPSGSLHLNLEDRFTIRAEETGSYSVNLKLFGFLSLKEITVDVLENMEVIPCGLPIGITIRTRGALVLGTGVVTAADGGNFEPAAMVLKTGDYIIAVDGKEIAGKEELIEGIQKSGKEVVLTILRNGETTDVRVERIRTTAGDYKIGVWVRDDTQGIGTLTYITTSGEFGALGHGITDVDTGVLMESEEGDIYEAEIVSVTRGRAGTPGELSGVIRKSESTRLGEVKANTTKGVFGRLSLDNKIVERIESKSKYGITEIALRQDVVCGKASILCQVDNELKEYDIEIESVDYSNAKQSKGLVIHITDEELIEKTGGIVQGMSGSPILQDGKLIGAVTHVFVRDASRGYGTFIENMLEK